MNEDQLTSAAVSITEEITDDVQQLSIHFAASSALRTTPDGAESLHPAPVEIERFTRRTGTPFDRGNRQSGQARVPGGRGPYVNVASHTRGGSSIPVFCGASGGRSMSSPTRRGIASTGSGGGHTPGSRDETGRQRRDYVSLHADYSIPEALERPQSNIPHVETAPGNMQQTCTQPCLHVAVRGTRRTLSRSQSVEEQVRNYVKAHGHGKVLRQSWSADGQTMIIEFQSPKCVNKLTRKEVHKLDDLEFHVIPIKPEFDDDQELHVPFYVECDHDEDTSHGTAQSSSVLDSSLESECACQSRDSSLDTANRRHGDHESISCALHNYFDERKIYGVRLDYVRETGRLVVILPPSGHEHLVELGWRRDSPDESAVITFEDRTLTLTPLPRVDWVVWVEGDLETDVLLASRLPDCVTKDQLVKYFTRAVQTLEPQSEHLVVNRVELFLNRPAAFVYFEHPSPGRLAEIDYRAIRRYVRQYPVRGHMMSVQRVPQSKQLKVAGLNDQITDTQLENHFSALLVDKVDETAAEADSVTSMRNVEVNRVQIDYALVTFDNTSDMKFAMNHHDCRTLQRQNLEITVYHTML